MEEVDQILKKMRLDADRDVRVLAGGEEQLVNTVSKDCLVVTQDEMDEQSRIVSKQSDITFHSDVVHKSRTRMRKENALFVSQDASPFFHTND